MRLNLGCGKSKITGCINIDTEESCKPDLVLDFVTSPLPYPDNSVERIYLLHVIEHIPESKHYGLFLELRRVLSEDGQLIIAYPEFTICARNYLKNYRGQRDFWKNTIYGLQRYPSDFHVTLMDSTEFVGRLKIYGFKVDIIAHEPIPEEHNTVVKVSKCSVMPTYVDILKEEIFSNG